MTGTQADSKMPQVSVIIPTHNRAGLLSAAVQSVLAQTFQDFEIIIVDDCSSDGTRAVVQRFADCRIRYLRHPAARAIDFSLVSPATSVAVIPRERARIHATRSRESARTRNLRPRPKAAAARSAKLWIFF